MNEVKNRLGLQKARNYGVGGGALCERNDLGQFKSKLFQGKKIDVDYPPIVSRWKEMDDDVDLIFVLIGTNDFNSGIPLGSINSTSKSEFNGGLNIGPGRYEEKISGENDRCQYAFKAK